jgi:predicted HTH transcriptional regulator
MGVHFEEHPLRRMIAGGEGLNLDFKKTINSAKKIARSLAAFANTEGGRLLVGVHDSGRVTGAAVEEEAYMIESAAHVFCSPPVLYLKDVHEYRGLAVLEIYVPKSENRPHSAPGDDDVRRVYIRVHDQVLPATRIALELMKRRAEPTGLFFTDAEKTLLEHLARNPEITLYEYEKIAQIPRKKAIQSLVKLTSMGLLILRPTEKLDYFSLSPKAFEV